MPGGPPRPLKGPAATGSLDLGRPQSHRYVRDAVCRLGEDARRTADSGDAGVDALLGSTSTSMWQRAFHQEAMECVEAMRNVVESANLTHFASRFDDWRKVDMKATAQLQQHVKELARINQSTEQFLLQCSSSADIESFRKALQAMSQRADELAATREAINKSTDVIAERASSKVMEAWKRDAEDIGGAVRGHTAEQRNSWTANIEHLARLDVRVGRLEDVVSGMAEAVRNQASQVGSLERLHREATESTARVLQESVKSITNAAIGAAERMAAEVRAGVAVDLNTVRGDVAELFAEKGSAGRLLGEVKERMLALEHAAQEEAAKWRGTAEQLREDMVELEALAERARKQQATLEATQVRATELGDKVRALEQDLSTHKDALEAARAASLSQGLKRIRELEEKGNLQVDRLSGDVKVLTQINFAPCQPTAEEPPKPEVQNPEVAAKLISDTAELISLFDLNAELEVQTKPGKGGTPAFWEQIAKLRAEAVRVRLEDAGLPAGRLNVSGLLAKGQGGGGLVVRLDKSLFAQAQAASGKRAASPKGAKR